MTERRPTGGAGAAAAAGSAEAPNSATGEGRDGGWRRDGGDGGTEVGAGGAARRRSAGVGNRDDGAEAAIVDPCEGCTSLCRTPCRRFRRSMCGSGSCSTGRPTSFQSRTQLRRTFPEGGVYPCAEGGTDAGDAATLSTPPTRGDGQDAPTTLLAALAAKTLAGAKPLPLKRARTRTDVSVGSSDASRAMLQGWSSGDAVADTQQAPPPCYKFLYDPAA